MLDCLVSECVNIYSETNLRSYEYLIGIFNDLIVVLLLFSIITIIFNYNKIHISEKVEGKIQASSSGSTLLIAISLYYIVALLCHLTEWDGQGQTP